jgi:translation initiation factor 3 subunit I
MVAGDSGRLITGSADTTVKLWNVQTGQQLFTFNFGAPTKSVDFSVGDKLAVITTDPFMELSSAIHVKRIAKDPEDRKQPLYLSTIFFTANANLFNILS